ncbi:MAG: acetyltransferase [Xenococcaceae cyanobacterium MO_207.B15]|nr:acetyltransferase [Xenococcaceae cyanobacterium MO_207.B15]
MFLKKSSGDLVEVLETQNLYDPFKTEILGRCHAGEEMQDPEMFTKSELIFPSGESLPRCWLDPDYKHLINKESQAVIA